MQNKQFLKLHSSDRFVIWTELVRSYTVYHDRSYLFYRLAIQLSRQAADAGRAHISLDRLKYRQTSICQTAAPGVHFNATIHQTTDLWCAAVYCTLIIARWQLVAEQSARYGACKRRFRLYTENLAMFAPYKGSCIFPICRASEVYVIYTIVWAN